MTLLVSTLFGVTRAVLEEIGRYCCFVDECDNDNDEIDWSLGAIASVCFNGVGEDNKFNPLVLGNNESRIVVATSMGVDARFEFMAGAKLAAVFCVARESLSND